MRNADLPIDEDEAEDLLIPFSAETKQGREEIWELIEGYLNAAEEPEESGEDKPAGENPV